MIYLFGLMVAGTASFISAASIDFNEYCLCFFSCLLEHQVLVLEQLPGAPDVLAFEISYIGME